MSVIARPGYSLRALLFAAAASVALVSCSNDDDRRARELAAPPRLNVLAPADASLPMAATRGLTTDVYFNDELQQALTRLQGVEETLGRLQGDLQGTALAMQRVETLRREIDALGVRFQSLQERVAHAGPVTVEPAGTVTTTTVTTIVEGDAPPRAPHSMAPTPLMGEMAAPEGTTPVAASTAAPMAPVVDETPKKVEKPSAPKTATSAGVQGVRVGAHADRVRIVLDVTGANTAFTASHDAAEKILTIELPKTKWAGASTQSLKGNPLVASYAAQEQGAGSVVAFSLKAGTRVLDTKTLKGTPTRLVIDLAK